MSTLNLRRFAALATLKTIALDALVDLLEKEDGDYVGDRIDLVRDPETFDYDALSLLLANPEDGFPVKLADALHHIKEMADEDGMEAILGASARRGIDLDLGSDPSPADVAVRLWLHDSELLERLHAERFIVKPKSFESYLARGDERRELGEPPAETLRALEKSLDDWFDKHKRGRHSKVFAYARPDATWFLVRHGMPMDRRGIIRDGQSTSSFERPEKYDVVSYVAERSEINIHAGTKGEKQLYREEFGRHLFGDPEYFPDTGKYTLAPIQVEDGEDALYCDDIDGIEWVTLREVRLYYRGAEPETVIRRAKKDLFAVLNARNQNLVGRPVFQASFLVKFGDSKNPRTVTLKPPNIATYQREADEDVVSRWLKARGFILAVGGDDDDA